MTTDIPPLPARYAIDRLIGTGATGAVYHARDNVLHCEVALKVVRRNLAVHRKFRARFAREVALSCREAHPHLVPIFDYGTTEDHRPFVSMDYAEGGNLSDYLETGPPLQHVLQLLDDVLDALAHLHARGLVHQDLKPHNVLLTRFEEGGRLQAWVSDLGEASALSVLTQDRKEVGGTPAFMAPEQLRADPQEMGPWTDLYPVGLMLFEAVAGKRPHRSEDRRELAALRSTPPPTPTRADGGPIPAALEELIDNLLDPEPRQRYDRAADVRRVLQRATHEMETGLRMMPRSARPIPTDPSTVGPMLPTGEAPLSGSHLTTDHRDGALRWNQVPPDPIAPHPPADPGLGALARASLSLFALREMPLVGRRELRQRLWDVARRVTERGEPGVIFVKGRSGTGKTRLVESIARPLDEGGHMETVRLRYHWPPGLDDGFRGAVRELLAPWQDDRASLEARLTRWLSRDRQLPLEVVAPEAAILARWCGHTEEGEVEVNSAVGLAYLYRHLDVRSWRGGACLVMDDIHRSAEAGDGLSLVQSLLDRAVGERPILVLATLASEAYDEDERMRARLQHLQDQGALLVDLPPLTLEETRELLAEALYLSPLLTDTVARICAGNPLAVRLLLREWANRGLLDMKKGEPFSLRDDIPIETIIPSSIEELYRKSLRAAVEAGEDPVFTSEALATAALAGQDPPSMVVREVAEAGVDELLASGVLRESGDILTFEHGSVQREAQRLADRIPEGEELHLHLAASWRNLGARSGLDINYPLGFHLLKAGDPSGATGFLLKAVRKLNEEGRATMSAWVADLALESADAGGSTMSRQEARRLAAESRLELRQYEEAEQFVREALTLEPMDRLSWARLHLLLSRVAMGRGDLDSGSRYLDQAAVAFESVRDREGLRDVAHGRASLLRLEGMPQKAMEMFQEALGLVRRDPRREVLILSGFIESMLMSGRSFGVDRYRERMMQVANDSGDTRNIAKAAYTSGIVYLFHRRLDLSERYLKTASALSATLGDHWLHMNCENNLGEVARFRGRPEQARHHYELYCRLAADQDLEGALAVGHLNLALLALQQRREDTLLVHLEEAEAALANQPRHWTWVFIGVIRADILAREHNEPRCRAWWSVAKEHGLATLHTPDLWLPLQRLAEAATRAGWNDIAQSALRLSRELGHHEESAEVQVEEDPGDEPLPATEPESSPPTAPGTSPPGDDDP